MEKQFTLSKIFRHLATRSCQWPKTIIVILLAVLVILASGLGRLTMDTSDEAMLEKNDIARVHYDQYRSMFGTDDSILIVFDMGAEKSDFLSKNLPQMHTLQTNIEKDVGHLKSVVSIINARRTYSEDDSLYVEDLLEGYPDHQWKNDDLIDYLLQQPSYKNRLISEDGRYTSMVIQLETFNGEGELLNDAELAQSVNTLDALVDNFRLSTGLNPMLTGRLYIKTHLDRTIMVEANITASIAMVLTVVFMIFFFRRASAVILPQIVIMASILCALGLMAWMGAPYTMPIGTLAPLMIALGIADSVHVLSFFYQFYAKTGEKIDSIIRACEAAGPAVLLTSLTTAAGFASFMAGDIPSISDLGFYSAVAVLTALIYSMFFIPAVLAVVPVKRPEVETSASFVLNKVLTFCENLALTFPKIISVIAMLLLFSGFYQLSKIEFSHDVLALFPEEHRINQEARSIDNVMHGFNNIEIIVDSGEKNGIYDEQFIQAMSDLLEKIEYQHIEGIDTENVYSVLTILKETHQALHENKAEFYALPDNRELIAQELLMFESNNSADLFAVVDDDFQHLKLSLKIPYKDAVDYIVFFAELDNIIAAELKGEYDFHTTGASKISASTTPLVVSTTFKSYAIAICLISLLMIAMLGLKLGLISMIGNLLPIAILFHIMVFFDLTFDLTTMMVGAIALGIVVDDTLHLLHHYKHARSRGLDAKASIHHSLHGVGRALIITSLAFGIAVMGNCFATLTSAVIFGALMGVVTFLALFADLIVLPAILLILDAKPQTVTMKNQINQDRNIEKINADLS
ncbi:MAG: MMPL family transporter [Pseudomonadales bacterium]|nr:MMPL family transporter [Pseudomonadales bacterium]